MYFMGEHLDSDDIEDIRDCLGSIRDKLIYVKSFFVEDKKKYN